jgi:hypothetical protein
MSDEFSAAERVFEEFLIDLFIDCSWIGAILTINGEENQA